MSGDGIFDGEDRCPKGAVLVRSGKGGRRREVGMDDSAWEQLTALDDRTFQLPVGPLFCIITGPTRGRRTVGLQQHLAAVHDEEILLASLLIHSYALAETAAAERLGGDARDFGGIEDWGTRLLATTGSTWGALKEGGAGAVEVAVVRNAYAHGGRRIDESAANRLRLSVREAPHADRPWRGRPQRKLKPKSGCWPSRRAQTVPRSSTGEPCLCRPTLDVLLGRVVR